MHVVCGHLSSGPASGLSRPSQPLAQRSCLHVHPPRPPARPCSRGAASCSGLIPGKHVDHQLTSWTPGTSESYPGTVGLAGSNPRAAVLSPRLFLAVPPLDGRPLSQDVLANGARFAGTELAVRPGSAHKGAMRTLCGLVRVTTWQGLPCVGWGYSSAGGGSCLALGSLGGRE